MERVILLADMNSFFASVHQAIDPSLRGKPVVVSGDPSTRHGVVLSASYEAKAKGVKTGMTVREARATCPEAIFVKSQYHLYLEFSSRILRIMHNFTPFVEPFSIDEAFLDVTGCQKLFGPPITIARKLKERIRQETGISCSVGIGPNKLLAKMAAGLEKPDGLTVLRHEDVPHRLWPLPVRELFGVGPRYEYHLNRLNIRTIGDLANFPVELLKRKFGVKGEVLWLCANGIDASPVDPNTLKQTKSIGQQITLPRDYRNGELKTVILELADLVSYRARLKKCIGKTVVLFLKDPHFYCLCRRQTLPEYTNLAADISRTALELLKRNWPANWSVRMVGLALANLVPQYADQPALFDEKEKIKSIEKACDLVRNKYGKETIFRAASLKEGCWKYYT
ncbi:MAG: DNA polymerase IV [Thermoanaerobacterales bacterium 50_218]|nr:MAG: DNA polymerase IV [Thermoanaerobacterales bacterium 50_218]HAA90152.1 DNA polymerase IV [Peptococcaceae bacterium]